MTKKQKRILWPAVLTVLLGLSGLAFVAGRPKTKGVSTETKTTTVATAQPEFRPRVRIYVHGNSVRPSVVHAWPGKTLISVENETGADISLHIEKTLLHEMLPVSTLRLPHELKRSEQEVTLGVGEYVFYEASRPGIRGQLIVEPRK